MSLGLFTVPSTQMTPVQQADVITLCSQVFHCDYAYYMDLPLGRTHVLAYDGSRLAAHALWLDRPLRLGDGPWQVAAYVEGVATQPDCRRQGYGSRVMRRLQQEISDYAFGALSPAQPGWYAQLGWQRWQGPLYILKEDQMLPTPQDCVMIYRTPRSGAIDLRQPLTGRWRAFEPW